MYEVREFEFDSIDDINKALCASKIISMQKKKCIVTLRDIYIVFARISTVTIVEGY